jgi:hypothetical protein
MAVIILSRRGTREPELHELLPDLARAVRGEAECFYCGHPQTSLAVHWLGSTGQIWLHPSCVVELSVRLFRDLHKIECRSDLYITARTTQDLRERLRAEERRS